MKTVNRFEAQVLRLLFDYAQADIPADENLLCWALSCPSSELQTTLQRLRAAGLLQEQRVRLTLPGLAIASNVAIHVRQLGRVPVAA